MVTPTGTWTILDDLAFQLSTGDISQGRTQIRDALAVCENWIDLRTKWLDRAWWASMASFAASTSTLAASEFGLWPSAWASASLATGSVLVWGVCEAAPLLVQTSIMDWSSRFPLNDKRLAPLRKYLAAAAASPVPLHDHHGNAVSPGFPQNIWTVLIFSEREEIRRLPTVGSKGLRRVRYGRWLMADRPATMDLPQTTRGKQSPVTILVDRSTTNIDQRTQQLTVAPQFTTVHTTNHFEFVTRISAQADAMMRRPSEGDLEDSDAPPFEDRWPCIFDEADFHFRLKIFEAKALCAAKPTVKPYQIKKYVIAVLAARRIWLAEPSKDIAIAATEIGKLIKSNTDGWAGLQHSESTDWIKQVIGGTGNYAFAKEAFNAISYDPSEHDDAQYRLLLQ